MAYQFIHVSSYSVKSGGAGIAGEAGRKPEHSRHVDQPAEPVLLLGVDPVAAWGEIERRHAAARVLVQTKAGTKERKLRRDENILLAAVASYPGRTEETDVTDPVFLDWQARTLRWLTEQHGHPLSVVLHLDESHPHIHFLTAPHLESGQRMADIHPGERAKRGVGGRSGKKVQKDHAYKQAMRAYQDSYHRDVALAHGQARLGPRRQRLSRAQWQAQQAEIRRQAELSNHFDKQRLELESARAKQRRLTVTLRKRESALKQARAGLKQREAEIAERERQASTFLSRLTSFLTFGRRGTERLIRDLQTKARADIEKLQETTQKAREEASERQKYIDELEKSNRRMTSSEKQIAASLEDVKKRLQAAQADVERMPDLQKECDNWRDIAIDLASQLELFTCEEIETAQARHANNTHTKQRDDAPSP